MSGLLLTPHQMRERLVEHYVRSAQAHGRVDRAAIERRVVEELQLVDAFKRNAPAPRRRSRPRRERPDVLANAQTATGTRITKTDNDGRDVMRTALNQNPLAISERFGAAVARMAHIVAGSGGSTDLTKSVENAEVPKLARRFLDTYSYYSTRKMAPPTRGVDHNPFRGLNDRDASRLFMRLVEDIADSSTGSLGAWHVPK